MKKGILAMMLLSSAVMITSCSKKNVETVVVPELVPQATMNYMPKATAIQMSGDYSNNVAVTFDADGNLRYYPAPSDITASSRPVDMGDGWWLNTQGISAGSVFTTWTFDEYVALEKTPSTDEIKAAVIPGATVTAMRTLPYTLSEARKKYQDR